MRMTYLKVADAVAGVGWVGPVWTKNGVRSKGQDLWQEYGPAVWVYTPAEKRAYEKDNNVNGTNFKDWLAAN